MMMKTKPTRGIVSVRAEASAAPATVQDAIDQINSAFTEFRSENDARLEAILKGQDDVVRTEKIERINNDLSVMQAAIDKLNAQSAAVSAGGMGGDPGAAADRAYAKAFSIWMRRETISDSLKAHPQASLHTGSDGEGGFVVPTETDTMIGRTLGDLVAMRRLARVISISGSVYEKPTSTTRAAGRWVAERGTRDKTAGPGLSVISIPVHELSAEPAATQTLLDDAAISIDAWLANEVASTFAEMEGAAFIDGDGAGKPRGILSYPTVADANWAWGKIGFVTTGKAAGWADTDPEKAFIRLIYSLRQGYRMSGAAFVMNEKTASAVRQFKDATTGTYLWQPSFQAGEPARLLGYPHFIDDNMPDVAADKFVAAFGDFQRAYTIADRIGIRVLRDPFTSRPDVIFATTKRVGGGLTNYEAIKLLKVAA